MRIRYIHQKKTIIIVQGKEFKGLNSLGGCWKRFETPMWSDTIITPKLVLKIIK